MDFRFDCRNENVNITNIELIGIFLNPKPVLSNVEVSKIANPKLFFERLRRLHIDGVEELEDRQNDGQAHCGFGGG